MIFPFQFVRFLHLFFVFLNYFCCLLYTIGKAEQFIFEMSKIQRLEERLESMVFYVGFQQRFGLLQQVHGWLFAVVLFGGVHLQTYGCVHVLFGGVHCKTYGCVDMNGVGQSGSKQLLCLASVLTAHTPVVVAFLLVWCGALSRQLF